MDCRAKIVYVPIVLTINPALVIPEIPVAGNFLEQAQAGDVEAFGEVCRLYETRLLRQAMTLCANETMAEDLAQETLVEAWKSLRSYNGRCQFFTWLCAILLNRYRMGLRKKRPIAFSMWPGAEQEQMQVAMEKLPDDAASPDEAAQHQEQAAVLRECIEALPAKYQQVIYLRFYVDDSLEGIAAALGCSIGTVKSQLFRALDKLRAMRAIQPANVQSQTKAVSV
jgi:RNA polymerase sigma-70 factor (ECF subfamily)